MNTSWYGQSVGIPFAGMVSLGIVAIVLAIIVIGLKGYALWHAARRSEKWWFIILLVVQTAGILDLVYLFFVVGLWHDFIKPKNENKQF